FMITKEKHAYRMLFFREIGITPIAEVSRTAEFQFSEGILGAPGGPAWQHGGMAWRDGMAGSRRLLAGNFMVLSHPPRYLMALCYFSYPFCSARHVGGPRGPRHERTTGILTVWAGAPRMTWTVS